MPKLPSSPPPLPEYKYHYSTEPKIRVSKKTVLAAMWEQEVVFARFSYRKAHFLVGDKTLCGIEKWRTERATVNWAAWDGMHCTRCSSTMKKIRAYYDAVNETTKETAESESE